jgi:hypothetical protein
VATHERHTNGAAAKLSIGTLNRNKEGEETEKERKREVENSEEI